MQLRVPQVSRVAVANVESGTTWDAVAHLLTMLSSCLVQTDECPGGWEYLESGPKKEEGAFPFSVLVVCTVGVLSPIQVPSSLALPPRSAVEPAHRDLHLHLQQSEGGSGSGRGIQMNLVLCSLFFIHLDSSSGF